MINKIPQRKMIVHNRKNNNKQVFYNIIKGRDTHIFISPEIAFSKKHKKSVLDQTFFTDRLALRAFDKIYLVEK